MIVCIAGKNKIAIEIAKVILERGLHLIACVNSNDDAINGWQPSYKKFCIDNNIKICTLDEVHNIEELLFLSLEYDKIIVPNNFKSLKLFNIHFSLLPKYKGMFTSILPILNNEKYSGVTFHKIDFGIDTGNIIFQKKFKINKSDNSEKLYYKYLENGIKLIKDNLVDILENNLIEIPQSWKGSSYYSKKTIDFDQIVIDPKNTAYQIHNFTKAFSFRPYQLPKFHGSPIYLSKILKVKSLGKPGQIIREDNFKFIINTIDFQIVLYKDQLQDFFKSIIENDIDRVKAIIKSKFPIETVNENGWNALMIACYHGKNEIIDLLIFNRAELNSANNNGTTVLMYAMTNFENTADSSTFKKIISLGADIYKKDFRGKNIFDYGFERKNILLIEELNKIKQ